jgi:starvation-inducible outer membrane lipoprotein
MRYLPLFALLLAGCTTVPTTDQNVALFKRAEAECQAKGYQINTREFQTCYNQLANKYISQSANNAVGTSAAR